MIFDQKKLSRRATAHSRARHLFVRVAGDSMTRAGIFDGDLLIVDKGAEVKKGQVVIGVVNQELMVKRRDYVHGMPVLRSEGAGHHHHFIMEGDEFTVWGVATHG